MENILEKRRIKVENNEDEFFLCKLITDRKF